MNLLLLDEHDFIDQQTVLLADHRFQHCRKVLKAKPGDSLNIGLVNDRIGRALVTAIDKSHIKLVLETLDKAPPPPLPLTIVMALPRPQVLKRIVHNAAEFGIKQLHLLHCDKVEKSYWQSRALSPTALDEQLRAGLMQSKDTVMPVIHQHHDFKRFIDQTLPLIMQKAQTFIAHPYTGKPPPAADNRPRAIIIGPEGGFSEREIRRFEQYNVIAVSMGARTYRVESAMTLLSGQLSMADDASTCASSTVENRL